MTHYYEVGLMSFRDSPLSAAQKYQTTYTSTGVKYEEKKERKFMPIPGSIITHASDQANKENLCVPQLQIQGF